jgi:ABC-type transport system involved in multi-copper enzyme maturation permease subunit
MKALLWKDFRVNHLVLAVGAGVLLAPHLLWLLIVLGIYWGYIAHDGMTWPAAIDIWSRDLMVVALWSLMLSGLTAALLGGNAVAGERADRSAEFLASLPVSRRQIIVSKAVLALSAVALIWAVNLLVIATQTSSTFPSQVGKPLSDILDGVAICACVTCSAFGVAWFFSVWLTSPALAACAGLLAPFILFMIFALLAEFGGGRTGYGDNFAVLAYSLVCALVGIAGFVAGTVSYLRRVEP